MPRLEPKLKHEKSNRSNRFVEVDIEERDVPMHRSYGKTRKIYPLLEKTQETILRGVLIYFLLFMAFAALLAIYAILAFSNVAAFWISVIAVPLVLFLITRPLRKRIKFLRKLKRFCKKNNFTLNLNRRFFASFLWNKTSDVDFTLKTHTHTYFVKFATAAKRNSDMIFLSKTEMIYRKLRLNNKFTAAFNLQPRIKKMHISFPEHPFPEGCTNVILLNPVPRDISVKDKDGVIVASGDGEYRFGYTVYSGTGFLQAVRRNESNTEFKF